MELEPLKHKKRKLTRFLCQELLLDYVLGNLDRQRRQAVEEFLPTCKDTQKEFETLKRGYDYAHSLHDLQIQKTLVEELFSIQSPFEQLQQKLSWRNWPETARWISEALLISAVVAMFAVLIPWPKLAQMMPKRSQDLVLAEAGREKKEEAAPVKAAPAVAPTPVPAPVPTPPTQTVAATTPSPMPEPVKVPEALVAQAPKVPTQTPPAVTPPATKATPAEIADATSAEEGAPISAKPKGKGVLYRAFMNIQNLEDEAPLITQEIINMGGEKAGQVELGWKKPGGHYYHFTLSEAEYENLLTSLRNFGPVRISSEPHPRVMPKGKIRIILWVEGPAGSGDE